VTLEAGLGTFVAFGRFEWFERVPDASREIINGQPQKGVAIVRAHNRVHIMEQTTLDDWAKDATVDPEVRAHVYSLISAVSSSQSPNYPPSLTPPAGWYRRRRNICSRRRRFTLFKGSA